MEGIVLGFAAVAVLELAAAATSRASRALLDHGGAGEDAWGSDMESIAGCFEDCNRIPSHILTSLVHTRPLGLVKTIRNIYKKVVYRGRNKRKAFGGTTASKFAFPKKAAWPTILQTDSREYDMGPPPQREETVYVGFPCSSELNDLLSKLQLTMMYAWQRRYCV